MLSTGQPDAEDQPEKESTLVYKQVFKILEGSSTCDGTTVHSGSIFSCAPNSGQACLARSPSSWKTSCARLWFDTSDSQVLQPSSVPNATPFGTV